MIIVFSKTSSVVWTENNLMCFQSENTVMFLALWMKPWHVTIQIEQYFYVVLFIMLYKVVLTFKSADETLMRDHSYESY